MATLCQVNNSGYFYRNDCSCYGHDDNRVDKICILRLTLNNQLKLAGFLVEEIKKGK